MLSLHVLSLHVLSLHVLSLHVLSDILHTLSVIDLQRNNAVDCYCDRKSFKKDSRLSISRTCAILVVKKYYFDVFSPILYHIYALKSN